MPDRCPKNVLITGASHRIGRALALAFAEWGWGVGVHYNLSKEAADTLVGDIRAKGGRAAALAGDLAVEAEVETLIGRATALLGPLGALVNNASQFEYDDVMSATRASWDTHLETNLRAPFVLIQNFARLLPADAEGAVINILDQRVSNLRPRFTTYTLSKAALWTLTQTLAMALAPRIRVNAIGPGPTLPSRRQTPEQFARQVAATPLSRGSAPAEIADAARFLVGAPAVTGQLIFLDGGQHLGWSPTTFDPEE